MHGKPAWLEDWRKRTRIINIIEKAYENNCNCSVCELVRELGEEMGELFRQMPPQIPYSAGGAFESPEKKKKK